MEVDGNKIGTYDGIVTICKGYGEAAKIVRFMLTANGDENDRFVSLNDCLEMMGGASDGSVTVIIEDVFDGKIFCYGNHGDYWEEVGTTNGYA